LHSRLLALDTPFLCFRLAIVERQLKESAHQNLVLKFHLIQNAQAAAAVPTTAVGVAQLAVACSALAA
jgi:hypothetical protein